MGKMIQIRDMPEEVHRRLKVRASHAGMTLSAYVLSELKAIAERPTPDEVLMRLSKLQPVRVGVDEIVDAVRAGRDELGDAAREGREGTDPAAAGGAEPADAAAGESAPARFAGDRPAEMDRRA
jgi:antitoxin FitA